MFTEISFENRIEFNSNSTQHSRELERNWNARSSKSLHFPIPSTAWCDARRRDERWGQPEKRGASSRASPVASPGNRGQRRSEEKAKGITLSLLCRCLNNHQWRSITDNAIKFRIGTFHFFHISDEFSRILIWREIRSPLKWSFGSPSNQKKLMNDASYFSSFLTIIFSSYN